MNGSRQHQQHQQQQPWVSLRQYVERIFAERDRQYQRQFTTAADAQNKANEFRQALDDQSRTMLPRSEFQVQYDALAKRLEDLRAEVVSLRESRSASTGSSITTREFLSYGVAVVAIIAALVARFL